MFEPVLNRMHNPPHPGEVLKEYLGDLTLKEVAAGLFISRSMLQRIVTGTAKISPDMAYRLSAAFGTSPELWAGMQLRYDLYQAGKVPRRKIERFTG